MSSLYEAFKKGEVYLDLLNAKAQIQKELKPKSGYKAFKFFEATITFKQNSGLCLYEIKPQKT